MTKLLLLLHFGAVLAPSAPSSSASAYRPLVACHRLRPTSASLKAMLGLLQTKPSPLTSSAVPPLTASQASSLSPSPPPSSSGASALHSAVGSSEPVGAVTAPDPPSSKRTALRERLLKLSNAASLLCVLDCTILPAVVLLLPLIGMGASPGRAAFLHELGHKAALWFVLPVGGTAASLNYISHRRKSLFSVALAGLSLVYAANAPHGAPIVSLLPHGVAHALHCGTTAHRVTNILGCALLLGSNYLSQRSGCAASGLGKLVGGDGDCGHDHGHHHGHDCKDNQ